MKQPVLYSFRRCPYAMRARFALVLNGVDYEHREILLRDKPQQMLAASPKGTVPVMQLSNGTVLEESLDIMHWAFAQEKGSQASAQEEALIQENDTTFKEALDRYKYPIRYEGDDTVLREEGYQICTLFFDKLEQLLQKNSYLFGSSLGFADIAIFPFIRQFSKVDADAWQQNDFPKLRSWLEGLCQSETFEQVMQKHKLWLAMLVEQ